MDSIPPPFHVAQLHADAVLSGGFLVEIISDGVALVNRPQPLSDAGVVKDMLQEHGLPDAAVAYNPNITFFSRINNWHGITLRIALV